MAIRTLKLSISKMDGSSMQVSIPNAAADSDLTTAKMLAFVDAYDEALGGNQLNGITKAIVTTSEDTLIYPID